MQTERGAYIPDELVFRTKSAFFITLNVGGSPSQTGDRWHPHTSPTLADLDVASKAVREFLHRLLEHVYGRYWMMRRDVAFSALAVPETKDKYGKPCRLHFHMLFDGSTLASASAVDFRRSADAIWQAVAQRHFRYYPGQKTCRVRSVKKTLAYITKWLDPESPHYAATSFKSAHPKFRVSHGRARREVNEPHFAFACG